jgi:3-keto steroid reductase
MSSIEASPEDYDPDDWQLLKTPETYALSKFQTDLIATRLDMIAIETKRPVRHIVVQPGVVATSIVANALNWFSSFAMMCAFYLVSSHLSGSVHDLTPLRLALWARRTTLSNVRRQR